MIITALALACASPKASIAKTFRVLWATACAPIFRPAQLPSNTRFTLDISEVNHRLERVGSLQLATIWDFSEKAGHKQDHRIPVEQLALVAQVIQRKSVDNLRRPIRKRRPVFPLSSRFKKSCVRRIQRAASCVSLGQPAWLAHLSGGLGWVKTRA